MSRPSQTAGLEGLWRVLILKRENLSLEMTHRWTIAPQSTEGRENRGRGVSLSEQAPPSYATPSISPPGSKPQSSSTGSSCPAAHATPVPVAVVSPSRE